MTPSLWLLVIISQAALVGGQIFLKRAMTRREQAAATAVAQVDQHS